MHGSMQGYSSLGSLNPASNSIYSVHVSVGSSHLLIPGSALGVGVGGVGGGGGGGGGGGMR